MPFKHVKRSRMVFYVVFAAYNLFIFLFSLYMDNQKENLQFLLQLQSKIGWLKFGSFIGVALWITDILWDLKEHKIRKHELDRYQTELDTLKARLFDLQEGQKK